MQFLVLAKGAKGAACVALIQQVLSNKKLFVFGELLAMPNVQAVRFSVRGSATTYYSSGPFPPPPHPQQDYCSLLPIHPFGPFNNLVAPAKR